ncbi:MAG: hypothetical protein ACOYUZ_05340 [Patescibacteria group bacterium]
MFKKFFSIAVGLFAMALVAMPVFSVSAQEAEDIVEVTAEEVGVSQTAANSASAEATSVIREAGMLIEIGNTTADETTIIIRVTDNSGNHEDKTVQINSATKIYTSAYRNADLSDWIAGDRIAYTAEEGDNSGELTALTLRNLSFLNHHHGRNGWVKAIRAESNEMDVEWAGNIYTLDTSDAKMVAGLVNPASLSDFQVGDRVRARVSDDFDGNPATWNASIIVVLRRGDDLFMRVTRWVVPAEITYIPEDTSSYPYTIKAKVLPSKFFEAGDVNNLIGAPGTEFTIQIDKDTKLVRRYLGRAKIAEFMEGDHIRVVGRLNEGTGNLDAKLIKNNSIQALGVTKRVTEVTAVDTGANTVTVKTLGIFNPFTGKRIKFPNGLEWTLELNENTKIYEMGQEITISDIQTGDIIRVRGVANRLKKTVDTKAISVITERVQTAE